jgi:hypothetical protein
METVGPWTKRRKLGQGGNAEVWSCRHRDDGGVEAVKFLKRQKVGTIGYERFIREIGLLRALGDSEGILPLLRSNLPPEDKDPADVPWISMPEAHSLRDGFPEGTPLEVIVAGVSKVAMVLARLAKQGIHHRDVKPENLFIHDGDTAIGDFGLATYPGRASLTLEGRKVGPLHYIAPEMLEYREGVDESRADVYSLAKTLWVLATGQRYPPPGEQRATEPAATASSYVAHPRSYLLDRLIESATRLDPAKRIDVALFADELQAWGREAPHKKGDLGDQIGGLNDRLQTAFGPLLAMEGGSKEYSVIFRECKMGLIAPLRELLRKIPALGSISVSLGEDLALSGTLGVAERPLEGPAIVLCGPGKAHRPLMFSSLGLLDQGQERTLLMAHHVVAIEHIVGPEVVWTDSREVLLGGSTLNAAMHELTAGLTERFGDAFRRYTELVERHKDEIR